MPPIIFEGTSRLNYDLLFTLLIIQISYKPVRLARS